MLSITVADSLEVLAARLCAVLAEPPTDPLAADWVAVPPGGVDRWLALRLARDLGSSGPGANDGVAANIISRPLTVLALLALAFILALGLIALTYAVMIRVGRSAALALAFAVGSRNVGLMLAAAGAAVPDLMWLYFALAQFPVYLLPQLLKPLARRINSKG